MGKFLKKSKTTGEVSLNEVSQHQSPLSLGVRTRAKTLALQSTQKLASLSPSDASSYLQLRSRRLEKTNIGGQSKRRRRPNTNLMTGSRFRVGSGCVEKEGGGDELERHTVAVKNEEGEIKSGDLGIEASFGENVLEIEGSERGTRETTPCTLMRDPVTVGTPGSTNKSVSLADANQTAQYSSPRHIVTNDMDAFFSSAEKQQQKQFEEKYNYDPVNDKPLPGRYEWVELDP